MKYRVKKSQSVISPYKMFNLKQDRTIILKIKNNSCCCEAEAPLVDFGGDEDLRLVPDQEWAFHPFPAEDRSGLHLRPSNI